jgi:hypothetical protein
MVSIDWAKATINRAFWPLTRGYVDLLGLGSYFGVETYGLSMFEKGNEKKTIRDFIYVSYGLEAALK